MRASASIKIAFAVILVLAAAPGCAAFNRSNTPLIAQVDEHLVPETTAMKIVASPLYVPAGALAGMLTGLIVTAIWRNTPALKSHLYELVPAFVLAFLAVWLVSLLTRPAADAELREG